jgi:hypothetical protein
MNDTSVVSPLLVGNHELIATLATLRGKERQQETFCQTSPALDGTTAEGD